MKELPINQIIKGVSLIKNMKEETKEKLPNCPWCGGIREVTEFDFESGQATIRELHETDCDLAVKWKSLYGTKDFYV